MSEQSTPYADSAGDYQRRGWSPVPLPPRCKKSPPTGWTGYGAPFVSGADVHEWASNGHAAGNVGLRLPATVLGLDLDNYDGKPGLATMLAAANRLGALPPSPRSTSRPDDPYSGIRFYRVPAGRRWADVLGPGVEIIHYGHRYAVAGPSVHPEGRAYAWYAPDGTPMPEPPAVDDLPVLPPAWVADLDRGDVSTRSTKADLLGADVTAWLDALPEGEPCRYVTRLLTEAEADLRKAASRHDTARGFIAKMLRAGDQGHQGAVAGLHTLESLWRASLARGKPREADPGEWHRMVTGGVAIIVKDPTSIFDQGCCPLDPPTVLQGGGHNQRAENNTPTVIEAITPVAIEAVVDYAGRMALEVEREAYRIRVRDAAREKVNTEKIAARGVPLFDAGLLVDVLARPAEPPHRVEGLIPSAAGTLIVAQRKTGKTTLQLNLARSLILGEDFLGRFPVRPVTGRVGFLNFEVSAAQLARWAQEADVPEDRLYLVNLRGRRNPFTLDADRDQLAEQLREHEVESLILDPFGRAFTGKSQNDPGEVGAWLAELDRFAREDGAGATDVILAAHAGWDGERTRGSSALEDWADSIVTLVRDREDDQLRYLRAEGRDVLVEEDRLDFDAGTRALRLAGAGSRKVAARTRNLDQLVPAVVEVVRAAPGITGYKVERALRDQGTPFQKGDHSKALSMAVDRGLIRYETGARNAKNYHPSGVTAPTYPDLPRPTPSGAGWCPTPTSPI